MTTIAAVIDQTCQFFGGAYDPTLKLYTSPTISGLATVARSYPKRDDFQFYTYQMPPGTATGAKMVVQTTGSTDIRVALPGIQGRRKTRYMLELNVFIWSTARDVQDAQDFTYQLRDDIIASIRTDPTLGSGGFEAGGFQVGEGSEDPSIGWQNWPPETAADASKIYNVFTFEAHAIEVA